VRELSLHCNRNLEIQHSMGLSHDSREIGRTANGVAHRSLSRKILLQLLALQPNLSLGVLASHLGVRESALYEYERGLRLMPLDLQERLSGFVVAHEPALHRIAHRLRQQVEAARRYEAGEVVRHMTSPP